MGRQKLPVDLIKAKGKSHLTKEEEERRSQEEVKVPADFQLVTVPEYLFQWPELVARFCSIAEMLHAIIPDNFGEPDAETLARYVVTEATFELYTTKVFAALKENDLEAHKELHMEQDRAFKQAQAAASVLGLSVTSRCKLVVPSDGDSDALDDLPI